MSPAVRSVALGLSPTAEWGGDLAAPLGSPSRGGAAGPRGQVSSRPRERLLELPSLRLSQRGRGQAAEWLGGQAWWPGLVARQLSRPGLCLQPSAGARSRELRPCECPAAAQGSSRGARARCWAGLPSAVFLWDPGTRCAPNKLFNISGKIIYIHALEQHTTIYSILIFWSVHIFIFTGKKVSLK